MIEEIECIVSGRVQMVMYRDFVYRHARKLGINGTVQNLPDGTVRVIAQGSREKLELFIADLKKGSLFSQVREVRVVWKKPATAFTSFSMVY